MKLKIITRDKEALRKEDTPEAGTTFGCNDIQNAVPELDSQETELGPITYGLYG
jgi:hypothetical protein